ncbi:C4-dicarboxylic acid transporter DauA [Granulosicoccaceae sp. 1_MG-2023]|nr:C4-dicarboxylic acid transporter DauA [Granulosicoccaceae sp. 1_MG-2023]
MLSALRRSIHSRPSLSTIQTNIMAGLTVGIIALPLSMALAIASGVAPQHGLYTAIVAGIVIALTGGSKVNISGPTAAFVVVLLPIVQGYGLGGLLIAGMMAGLILIIMGFARFGKLIEIVPYPVVVGFTTGIGVVIATFQIKDFFGLPVSADEGHYVDKVAVLLQALPDFRWQETLIGALTLAVLILWSKTRSKIPAHLVALLCGSLAALFLGMLMPDFSVATIGSRFQYVVDGVTGQGIPPVLPAFSWPWQLPGADGEPIGMSYALIRELMPAALTIAVLGALESLLCAVVADGMSGKKHDPNDELIGQGLGNLVAPLFGGIPATAAIARTATNVRTGGSLPLSSVVHSLFILVAILVLAPLLAWIPMASMAALLLIVAWNMSEIGHFIRTLRIAPRHDVMVLLTCFLLTVLFDMTIAVATGMGLAAVLFIRRSIDLTHTTLIEKQHETLGDLPDGVVIYDINGPLFFGSARKAVSTLGSISGDIRAIVLNMREVSMLDMSALVAMEDLANYLKSHNIALVINELQPRMALKMRRAGIRVKPGEIAFARALPEAIEKAARML